VVQAHPELLELLDSVGRASPYPGRARP
jgi:hypothetical protein